MSLVAELKRRRVFRALVGYGIAAFAVLQIVEPVMHGLRWPDAVLGYVVVGGALQLHHVAGTGVDPDVVFDTPLFEPLLELRYQRNEELVLVADDQ